MFAFHAEKLWGHWVTALWEGVVQWVRRGRPFCQISTGVK